MLLFVFKSVKIKSFLYTAKIIISLSLVLGLMPISNSRRDAFSRIFSVISDPSQWTCGIYCVRYPMGGGITVTTYIRASELSDEELSEKIYPFLDPDNTNPNIDTVQVKRIPLDIGTVFSYLSNALYHAYVILEIKGYYVSLEKHSDSLTIQISRELNDVLQAFRGNRRCGEPELIVEDRGNITVRGLRDFIVDSDFVNEGYNVFEGNHCKRFAKDIFDRVALTNEYHWEEEERREIHVFGYIAVPAAAIIAGPAANRWRNIFFCSNIL